MRLLRILLRSTRLERYAVSSLFIAHMLDRLVYPREDEE
jgi:hypothetical protein